MFFPPAGGSVGGGSGELPASSIPRGLLTRAERTNYTETTHYSDMREILDSLARRTGLFDSLGNRDTLYAETAPMRIELLGLSPSGVEIPYVVAARPMVRDGAEAHRLGRPVVYIQANVHGGEIEGKEALLQVLRDLLLPADTAAPGILDSVVIVAVPIYNIDGNEAFAPQAINRPDQNGPEMVGTRANGQGLDLNRDFIKAEAPETQGTLNLFNTWDPDVFVDLHTTDGTFHGYAMTFAPPLNPSSVFTGPYTRDTLLPAIEQRLRNRYGYETFSYGNLVPERGPVPDTVHHAWETYDARPRFGTNYVGLRGRIGILCETYAHDTFERRTEATRAFLHEMLQYVSDHSDDILYHSEAADSAVREWVDEPNLAPEVSIASQLSPIPHGDSVLIEDLARAENDTVLTEPGVPRGLRRTGVIHYLKAPVLDRFESTASIHLPFAYALPAADSGVAKLLSLHGIEVQVLRLPEPADVEKFAIDSVHVDSVAFQGHHEVRVSGQWQRQEQREILPIGTFLIPSETRLGVLTAYLLEPTSDDGLVTWNFFDQELQPGGKYPVMRILD